MSDRVERVAQIIRDEMARQARNDEVLLFDPKSGMVDGVIDIHALAGKIAEAVEPTLPRLPGGAP
jgi:hypothetical protein